MEAGGKKFSVYFWPTGSEASIREKHFVSAEEAVDAARRLTSKPSCFVVDRVMITDELDFCNFEWTKKDGIVFPKKEDFERRG